MVAVHRSVFRDRNVLTSVSADKIFYCTACPGPSVLIKSSDQLQITVLHDDLCHVTCIGQACKT